MKAKKEAVYHFILDQTELTDFEKFLKHAEGKGIPSIFMYIKHRFESAINGFKEED